MHFSTGTEETAISMDGMNIDVNETEVDVEKLCRKIDERSKVGGIIDKNAQKLKFMHRMFAQSRKK